MWNKRNQLVALTAVAGLLAVPASDALADHESPFGNGNPIQSLSKQIDRLERRVRELENPPIPTSLNGLYSVTSIWFCNEAVQGGHFEWFNPDGTVGARTIGASGIRRVTRITTQRYTSDGPSSGTIEEIDYGYRTVQTAPIASSTLEAEVRANHPRKTCYSYEMTAPPGTFTKKASSCGNGNGDSNFKGSMTLKGRVFDGGKTLTLISTTPEEETAEALGVTRLCARTETARKIAD